MSTYWQTKCDAPKCDKKQQAPNTEGWIRLQIGAERYSEHMDFCPDHTKLTLREIRTIALSANP